MMMLRRLRHREIGRDPPHQLPQQVRAARARALALSSRKDMASGHKSGINALQVDLVELRYLLAGATDGSLALYDTLQPTPPQGDSHHQLHQRLRTHQPLYTIAKSAEQGHRYAVSSVQWYPVDNGLFASASFDRTIKLWDTNTIQVSSESVIHSAH